MTETQFENQKRKRWGTLAFYLLIIGLVLAIGWFFLLPKDWFASKKSASAEASEYVYVCPMGYPEASETPGVSKFCGMELIKKKRSEVPFLSGKGINEVRLSPSEMILANVGVSTVEYKSLEREINTVGKIDYNETRQAHIAARFSGRVEKLHVNFTGEKVKKGEPLLEIYSPDLVTTQQEYILALENFEKTKSSSSTDQIALTQSLVESTKNKLLLWGITEEQILNIETSKKVQTTMTIFAPIGGIITKKEIVEGQYVSEGQDFFQIDDLAVVWMYADIYEYEISFVKLGQKVEVTTQAYPGEVFFGKINFIAPTLNPLTRTLSIRAEFHNSAEKLKPEMYVNAKIKVASGKSLVVPATAVLSTGKKEIVWVQVEAGVFQPREVKTGIKSADYHSILEGLKEGEKVVSKAGFLLDSESQLMLGGAAMSEMETPIASEEEMNMEDLTIESLEKDKKQEEHQH
ncbi:MAG: hypothetical protein RBG1_1C00001G0079 [candidate division Zixibacteria bacterium RBG-1]|nr:MAG: hypothetical protein RBG1_1C00001G0079 [candidate division Zixibacteria bacterium RBG-1]OGC84014.1 MAG: hypothetical protein A2V73_00005 [candidate division Zixibacteria bacterium RBG_19FT_COMBO_42_43]